MKTSVLFPITVVLLFHQVIMSTSSKVPEEAETSEASLFSPSSSLSSSQPLESNIVLSTRATSPLYTLLTQRKMETSGLPGAESGGSSSGMCSSDQLIEKMVQPDMLVTAIKLYIDSFGLEATKSLINPVLGLPNAGADRNIDQAMGKENKGSDYRGRMNDVTSAELSDSNSDQDHSLSSQEAFGESFRGAIDIGVNFPHGQVMTGIPHHHSGQGNPIGGMISNPSLLSTRIGESLPTLPLTGSLDSHPTSNTGYRSLVASRISPLFPGRERVLLIPGRRIRPFSSKVRISASGKVREVKITVAPFMNILSALRQAEQQIQWKYPELATRKVIEIGSLDDNSKENSSSSPGCYSVTKVGPIEANEEHFWTIKLTLKSGEVKFEGSCVPSIDTDDVRVKPGSTIDLIYH